MTKQFKLRVKKPTNPSSLYQPTITIPHILPPTSLVQINGIIYAFNFHYENTIELNGAQRENHGLMINNEITVREFTKKLQEISLLRIRIEQCTKRTEKQMVNRKELMETFMSLYNNYPLSDRQLFYFKVEDKPLRAEVTELVNKERSVSGLLFQYKSALLYR